MFQYGKSFSSLASQSSSNQNGSKSLNELNESKDFDGVMRKIMMKRAIVIQQQDYKDHKPIISTKSKNDIDQVINQVEHIIDKENEKNIEVGSHTPLFDKRIQQSTYYSNSEPNSPIPTVIINQVMTKVLSQDIDEVTNNAEMIASRSRSNSNVYRRKRAVSLPPTNENFVSAMAIGSRDIDDFLKENK